LISVPSVVFCTPAKTGSDTTRPRPVADGDTARSHDERGRASGATVVLHIGIAMAFVMSVIVLTIVSPPFRFTRQETEECFPIGADSVKRFTGAVVRRTAETASAATT